VVLQNTLLGQNIFFGRYSSEDGLSNSRVFCVLQDKYGFLWFGTDDGLNRFDGYEFKVYRNEPSDSTSLSDNSIRSLYEDRYGFLWIGTKSGEINRYDPELDKFEYWKIETDGLKENSITSIYQDKDDHIWLGTYKNGLYKFSPNENKFEHWNNDPSNANSLSINYVTSILEDNNNELWISSFNGLNKFQRGDPKKPFVRFYRDLQNSNTITDNLIWRMSRSDFNKDIIWIGTLNGLTRYNYSLETFTPVVLPDRKELQFGYSISSIIEDNSENENILWIGTFGGLIRLNLNTGFSERFIREETNPYCIASNQIHDVYKDRSGVIWIATDNGLSFFSHKKAKFNYILSQNSETQDLSQLFNKSINSISQSADRTLWFGSKEGLFQVSEDAFHNRFIGNAVIQDYPESNHFNIWSLEADEKNNLWIGTYGEGLKQFNLNSKQIKSWEIGFKEYELSSAYKYIKTICSTRDGMIWIGFWGGGAARLNPRTGEYKIWRNEHDSPGSISYNDVWAIIEDRKGRIWLGTNGGGLNLFKESGNGIFYNWVDKKTNKAIGRNVESLSSNSIYCIYASTINIDENKTVLWIGTRNGLNKFTIEEAENPSNQSELKIEIKYYTIKDGLPDNSIESIVEDEKGKLWIGTGSGISKFDINEETFTNFSISDGLIGNEFNSSAAFRSEGGLMFLGSSNGLNVFKPEEIRQSSYQPAILITDFLIFNRPVKPGRNSPLIKNIIITEQIKLSYSQNVFSFQFAALDFNSPYSNQYAYIMEGFEDDWTSSKARRFVTYTNLDPGEYTFKVKATNSDGLWNDNITSLRVIITPPVWATWYAYVFYVLFFIAVLLLLRKYELEKRAKKVRERLRKNKEEAAMRELTLKTEAAELKARAMEQEKEIEKQKIRNRIARDLHDEIGSNLSSISLMSRMIKDELKSDSELSQNLSRIESTAKNSVTSIRDIVWFINPASDSLIDLIRKMNETSENMLIGKEYFFRHNIPDSDLKITLK
jgi:ligand-binding sensor domain-containing protein